MKYIILCSFLSCSLAHKDIATRNNETKIRTLLEEKREQLLECTTKQDYPLEMALTIDQNKQIKYFSIINQNISIEVTNCLFKKLDLFYFDKLNIEKEIEIEYSL